MLSDFQKLLAFPRENLIIEKESEDYGALQFTLNNYRILFRVAKITPKKVGQFVTLWKRMNNGPIQPFDVDDPFDFIIIEIKSDRNMGHFIFPKNILCEKDIFSKNNKGGKRAMRVYAPWDKTDNKQALKTQAWQIKYFIGK
ncbi:MAG: MepB family protein [Coxiellaceae bacterium]|nr:MepB family protein [Coxiellaceae bacterium]